MKNHYHTIHEGHNQNHKCISCGKLLNQPGALNLHIQRVHEGIKKQKCEPCQKKRIFLFFNSGDMMRHVKNVHEGRKDYKCDSCPISFSKSHNLKVHIRTVHEGYKDYKCDFCGKSFSQSAHLRTHIKLK